MFTFIPSLLNSDHPGKQHFEDMFSAVSIAAFSSRPNAGRAAIAANMYYARGVSRLRKALGDKTHAKSDTALASTILLAFYEVRWRLTRQHVWVCARFIILTHTLG